MEFVTTYPAVLLDRQDPGSGKMQQSDIDTGLAVAHKCFRVFETIIEAKLIRWRGKWRGRGNLTQELKPIM